MRKALSVLLLVGLFTALLVVVVAPAGATPEVDQVCDPLDSGKIDTTGDPAYVDVVAPEGYLINGYCVKAGSARTGDGPEYVRVDPAVKELRIVHSSGKDVSHYSLSYVKVPPTTTTTTTTIIEDPWDITVRGGCDTEVYERYIEWTVANRNELPLSLLSDEPPSGLLPHELPGLTLFTYRQGPLENGPYSWAVTAQYDELKPETKGARFMLDVPCEEPTTTTQATTTTTLPQETTTTTVPLETTTTTEVLPVYTAENWCNEKTGVIEIVRYKDGIEYERTVTATSCALPHTGLSQDLGVLALASAALLSLGALGIRAGRRSRNVA